MAGLTDPEVIIDWDNFFAQQVVQSGKGAGYFQGQLYQRGHGIGNIFRGIFKFLLPMAKSVAKTVGKQALHTGMDIVSDTVHGHNLADAAMYRGREGAAHLIDMAKEKMAPSKRGGQSGRGVRQTGKSIKGKKRAGKKAIQLGIAKKRRTGDVFDDDAFSSQ